ncbi:MAG: PDZ domain-containing protein [Lentisphaerae bacterium]|nr:PDZ domain-containing protein [Lentisphaerota bacterium]
MSGKGFLNVTCWLLMFCAATLNGADAVVADSRYTQGDFRRITAMTAKILDQNHYSQVKMTPELSRKIFDFYFDALDPMHMFFTDGEIKRFTIYRDSLGSSLQYGEYEFAFQIYDLYRRRYADYRKFTGEMLAKKIDFTIDEELTADPGKQPRPENKQAMHELWRKHIKNELLTIRLRERAEADEKSKSGGKKSAGNAKDPAKVILQRQRDVSNNIEKRDRIDILGILLDAMARAYGAHSDYQAPKLSEDFEIHMSLSLSGIGATLTNEDGYVKIVELVPGGPAAQSGKLKVNDRIVSLTQENGEFIDLIDMPVSKAVQYIRGEKGSKVTLDILSGNSSAPVKVTLIRDKVNLTAGAAKGEIKESNGAKVGVITLPSFYMDFEAVMRGDANARRASRDVLQIIEKFKAQSVDSILLDLRGNGGGSLPDAVALTGLFLSGGTVVQVSTLAGVELEKDPSPEVAYNGPLVILTSKLSASSTEILTGALRDTNRAVVVGDSRTFGKGTVLRVESLDRYNSWFRKHLPAGSLTFEIAMFFRPGGSSVQQLGISPDIQLPSLTEEMKVGEIFLDNHLPWDSIAPVTGKKWDTELDKKIAVLKKKSDARIAADRDYQAFIRQIELFRSVRDRKSISLNENKRYAEYRREKEISEEADRLFTEGDSGKKNNRDVVLEEAVNIAADLSRL